MSREVRPKDRWMTPPDLLRKISEIMGSDPWIDLACSEENALATSWVGEHAAVILGERMDLNEGLFSLDPREIAERSTGWAWLNPPYSRGNMPVFTDWLRRYVDAGGTAILCSMMAPTAGWYQRNVRPHAHYVIVPTRRVQFIAPEGVRSSSAMHATILTKMVQDPRKLCVEAPIWRWLEYR